MAKKKEETAITLNTRSVTFTLIVIAFVLLTFNQYMILQVSNSLDGRSGKIVSLSKIDLSESDFSEIKSTGQSIAALFPVEKIKTEQDAIDIMIPIGTPEYGEALGVSFDDPLNSLSRLVSVYTTIKLSEEDNQRYVNLVTKPVGISCEFCCGVGPVGADSKGNSICGCQHSPALLGLTKWLIQNTDYTDVEITREALRWKTLFFPKDMIKLAVKVAGGDASALENLPGMVGGC